MKVVALSGLLGFLAGCHPPEGHHGAGFHHRFENAEKWAKAFDAPDRDAWQKPEEVLGLLALKPGMTVADLGAGTGYFLPYLSPAVGATGTVLALDVEPDMVRYMEKRALASGFTNVQARVVAGNDAGLRPGSVDRILIVDTWHHIDDRPAYVKKLLPALRPGGFVLVVDFTREAKHGPPPHARLLADTVSKELEGGGLVATILPETLSEQYAVMGRLP